MLKIGVIGEFAAEIRRAVGGKCERRTPLSTEHRSGWHQG
jgi:hypothetical protein